MTNDPTTVLVVGATGSIGRLVVDEALRQGNVVRALVRTTDKARRQARSTSYEIFLDPQVKETGIVQPLDHPKLGKIEILGQPIKLSRTPTTFRRAPPQLGEHTDEVLAQAGFSAEEIPAANRI